jgi:hypothetical protein
LRPYALKLTPNEAARQSAVPRRIRLIDLI